MRLNTRQAIADPTRRDLRNRGFESASVVLPVINEVRSLRDTIDILFESGRDSILEVIIVVCHKTTEESLAACADLQKRYSGQVRMIQQTLPFLGGALREGLLAARGSHVILMYSDGESDPRSVIDLIGKARENPESVVSASRWLNGNSFEGYPAVKTLLNYLFQKTFSLLYWKNITDFTFGYRIYPTPLIQGIEWHETGHAFVFESIIKPLRLKTRITEIPTTWKARTEGESQLKPFMYVRYIWVGLKVRISRRNKLAKTTGQFYS